MAGAVTAQLVAAGVLPRMDAGVADVLRLDPVPPAAGLARRFVASRLAAVGAHERDTAVLVASELVTNAVLHAGSTVELGIAVLSDRVVLAVSDRRSRHPRRHTPDENWEGGRGLVVVDALVEEYGVLEHEDGQGKTVWVTLGHSLSA